MFDIGWGELVLIGLVALIVIGPKELPTVLRTAGQWVGKAKRMAAEFQGQFQEALREAEVADLKEHAENLTGELKSITNYDPMADVDNDGTASTDDWGEPFNETPEHNAAVIEGGHETETAAEDATKPAVTEHAAGSEPAPAAPVTAVESASVEAAENLTPAETPPPKQAGGTA